MLIVKQPGAKNVAGGLQSVKGSPLPWFGARSMETVWKRSI